MSDWLEFELWGNSIQKWLIALGVTVAVILALRIFKGVVLRRLRSITEKTKTHLDDLVVETLQGTKGIFYLVLGVCAGSRLLDLSPKLDHGIVVFTSVAFFVQVGAWIHGAVQRAVDGYQSEPRESEGGRTMVAAIGFITRLVVWAIVLLLILSNLGIEVSALVAGLGIGGVAAAFAMQNVLGDLFASLSIYFDRPFDIGDFIVIDDFMGNVDAIGLRSTRLLGLGGEQLVFANGDLAKSRIRNYRRMSERRVLFRIGIEYNLPYAKVERVAEILRECVDEAEGIRLDRAHFAEYGDSSLQYEVVHYVQSSDYTEFMERQHHLNLAVYRRFEEEGIPFAFPTRTVHVVNE